MDDRNGSSCRCSIKLGEGEYEIRTWELSLSRPKIYHYSISFLSKGNTFNPMFPLIEQILLIVFSILSSTSDPLNQESFLFFQLQEQVLFCPFSRYFLILFVIFFNLRRTEIPRLLLNKFKQILAN